MKKKTSRTTRMERRKVLPKKRVVADYKNAEELVTFLTDRGKIMPRSKTGVSQKYQRQLEKAIKRARHLALLPFAPKA